MDENLLFIPPCCVDKKLPQAIKQAPHRALSFYTHGDVTMEKFYRAISYLVDDSHVMVLTMPTLDQLTADFLYQCFSRGWISDLVLSTHQDFPVKVLRGLFSQYSEHILLAADADVADINSHLVLYSPTQSLSIAGPMYITPSLNHTVAYTMLYQPRYDKLAAQDEHGNPLLNILLPDMLRQRKAYRASTARTLSPAMEQFLSFHVPPQQQ